MIKFCKLRGPSSGGELRAGRRRTPLGRTGGEADGDAQSRGHVLGADATVMHGDDSLDDRQTKADAAGRRMTAVVHAHKRLEDLAEHRLWHALAKVSD